MKYFQLKDITVGCRFMYRGEIFRKVGAAAEAYGFSDAHDKLGNHIQLHPSLFVTPVAEEPEFDDEKAKE